MTPHDLSEFPVHGPNGRIAALRGELRMKQADFAKAVDTSRETVSHWENVDGKGEPRQRTTRRSAAAIAHVARDRLGWDVDGSFFHRDEETVWDQFVHQQKKIVKMLEQIDKQLPAHNASSAGVADGAIVAQRLAVGDTVGWWDLADRPEDRGEVLAVEYRAVVWLDFYCDPCDEHWSIPDENGYWRERIADTGHYPDCPAKDSIECDERTRSYTTAIRWSQNVTVDFGGRWGGPAELSGDHLRLIARKDDRKGELVATA